MECTNTGNVIRQRWGKYAKPVFYGICIPTRIFIGLIVWYVSQVNFEGELSIAILSLIFGVISCYSNFKCIDDKTTWWSRKVGLFFSLVFIAFAAISITNIENPENEHINWMETKWLAVIIWIHLIWGLFLSCWKTPFN